LLAIFLLEMVYIPKTPDCVVERRDEEDKKTWEQQEVLTTPGVSPATIVARYITNISILVSVFSGKEIFQSEMQKK